MPTSPPTVFVCYSHEDRPWHDKLVGHLGVLEAQGRLRVWSDERMGGGEDWEGEILERLATADAAVILVSRHSLTSEFILKVEVATLLQRRRDEKLPVYPVIARQCAWKKVAWLAAMQCRPRGGKNLGKMPLAAQDEALTALVEEIEAALPLPAGGVARPPAAYRDQRTQEISEKLARALQRRKDLVLAGEETDEVDAEIRGYKGDLRSGPQLLAGDFLDGRYELLDPIGGGGFATVWKAWDEGRQGVVAVKVLHGHYSEDKTRRDRFFRGARQMARLNHPGVVRVVEEHGVDDGRHFFVMEYLPGGDLRRAVLDGRLSQEEAVESVLEMGDALTAAHARKLVHRDVKPANILIDAEGRPRLTDFDLVRAPDTHGGTRSRLGMGSWAYAAPEVLGILPAGKDDRVNQRADVYSLAMTLTFALHCQDLSMGLVGRQEREAFLRELPCPETVRDVLLRATASRPKDRPSSVRELTDAVRAALKARTPEAVERSPASPEPREPPTTPRAPETGAQDLADLVRWVEADLPGVRADDRTGRLREAVSRAPAAGSSDLRAIGALAWALDYHLIRDGAGPAADAGRSLREELLEPLRSQRPPPDLATLVWADVPAGSFDMGSAESQWRDERPVRRVEVSPFRMLTTPVTNAHLRLLRPSFGGEDRFPAVGIDWYFAYAFSAWLGGRLPTEAEWEYACRAGSSTEYWSGDQKKDLARVGWYGDNSEGRLHEVGEKPANPWGLHDLHGNVWEWVGDWFGSYGSKPERDPWGPPHGTRRVFRGGSYWNDAAWCRAACRDGGNPWNEFWLLGFRPVVPGPRAG